MSLRNNFERRFEDVKIQYEHLSFIDKIEAYKNLNIKSPTSNDTIIVTSELQKCLKSQLILTLYNVVEFTTYEALQTICDTIKDESITFSILSNKVFNVWLKWQYNEKLGIKKIRDLSKKLILHPNETIELIIPYNIFSGNVDYKKIKEVFSELGCNINFFSESDSEPKSLLKIKNARNKLAHGNIAFSDLGSTILLREIDILKKDVFKCMDLLVKEIEGFIANKKYIKQVTSQSSATKATRD